MLEFYQTFGATVALFLAAFTLARPARMSWENIMKVGFAGLVCAYVALPTDLFESREIRDASLTSRMVADPACTTVDVTMDGDSVEKWLVACPKKPGRPL